MKVLWVTCQRADASFSKYATHLSTPLLTSSLNHLVRSSLTHSFTHSLTHPPTQSLTD